MESGRFSRGADGAVSQTKWDAERKGLGAFCSSKAPGGRRATRPAATVLAAPSSPEEVDPARPITLQEDPSDILARLASEALDIDASTSSPNRALHNDDDLQQEELDGLGTESSSFSPSKSKQTDAGSVTSPDYNTNGERWQAVGEYPLERLLLAAQRSATQKLLRVIDGDGQAAPDSDQELDDEETGGSVVMDGSLSGALEMATDSRPASRGAEGGPRLTTVRGVAEEVQRRAAGTQSKAVGAGASTGKGKKARRDMSGSPVLAARMDDDASSAAASPADKPQLTSPQSPQSHAGSDEAVDEEDHRAPAKRRSAAAAAILPAPESVVGLDSDLLGPGDRSAWGSAGAGGTHGSGPGLGLAHPDIQLALMRIKAAEERLKARETTLAQKEAAVAQVRCAHSLGNPLVLV